MKKKRVFIIILIIILVLIATIIFCMTKYYKGKNTPINEEDDSNLVYKQKVDETLTELNGETTFDYIIDATNRYYKALSENNKNTLDNIVEKECKDKVKWNNNKIKKYYVSIKRVYRIQKELSLSANVVNVDIIDKDRKSKVSDTIIIRIDLKNTAFAITPNNCITNKEKLVEGEKIQFSENEIEINQYNSLKDSYVSAGALAEFYYNQIKNLSLYDINEVYDLLDKEKTNVNDYKNNINKLFDEHTSILEYKRRINSDGVKTIECKDSKKNEYIIIMGDTITDFRYYKK